MGRLCPGTRRKSAAEQFPFPRCSQCALKGFSHCHRTWSSEEVPSHSNLFQLQLCPVGSLVFPGNKTLEFSSSLAAVAPQCQAELPQQQTRALLGFPFIFSNFIQSEANWMGQEGSPGILESSGRKQQQKSP